MRGSTPLEEFARRVQQAFDPDVEAELLRILQHWQKGSPRVRQRLGEPDSVVLELELVFSLSERLRAAPWTEVVTAAARDDSQIRGAESALLLLQSFLAAVHIDNGDEAPASVEHSGAEVLQSLLRQVCLMSHLGSANAFRSNLLQEEQRS